MLPYAHYTIYLTFHFLYFANTQQPSCESNHLSTITGFFKNFLKCDFISLKKEITGKTHRSNVVSYQFIEFIDMMCMLMLQDHKHVNHFLVYV